MTLDYNLHNGKQLLSFLPEIVSIIVYIIEKVHLKQNKNVFFNYFLSAIDYYSVMWVKYSSIYIDN